MNVLLVHNRYQQPGGEDQVVETEAALLEAAGHRVERYGASNEAVARMGRLALARATLWNRESHADVHAIVRERAIDVVHVHNSFPLLSPSVHHAARAAGAAVVQTLHNYRLHCPAATLFREGRACQTCAPRALAWPALVHGCYRDSRVATAGAVAMLGLHRALRTWQRSVHAHIALSELARGVHVRYGLPRDRVHVKGNALVPDPGCEPHKQDHGLFAGRLTPEKGVRTLLAALRELAGAVALRIAGSGPLEAEVSRAAREIPRLTWLGPLPHAELLREIGNARFVVVPSEWQEPFGRIAVESLARGTPVVAARAGALEELVAHGRSGLHFRPGDPGDLAAALRWLASRPLEASEMAKQARREFETRHRAQANRARLEAIYRIALATRDAGGTA